MSEKDRKPGQNGKGSNSRVGDTKTYSANYSQINWTDKKVSVVQKVNSFDSSRFLKVGDTVFNLHTNKIAVVYKIDERGDVYLKFNSGEPNKLRFSIGEIDDNWAYYNS